MPLTISKCDIDLHIDHADLKQKSLECSSHFLLVAVKMYIVAKFCVARWFLGTVMENCLKLTREGVSVLCPRK